MGWKLKAKAAEKDLSANLRAVLETMADVCAEDDPTQSYASHSYLAYDSGYSVRHVRRIVAALEKIGYVTCLTPGRGRGNTNHYHIHLEKIPDRPRWGEMKARLVELGELEPDARIKDVHAAARRLRRSRERAPEQEPAEGSAE